jgi:AmiR/NasT family two-component response regulator
MHPPWQTFIAADDDPYLLRQVTTALEGQGYRCVGTTENGSGVLDLVRRVKPDIAILDFHMPGVDGLGCTPKIAESGTTAVVILTGDNEPTTAGRAMDLGASAVVQKPFKIGQLVSSINSAWEAFQSQRELDERFTESTAVPETLQLFERARDLLIEQQHCSAQRAKQILMQMCQDQSMPLADLCRSVIRVRTMHKG